ncbi:MAG: hypothetical protein U0271_42550 [Polyangiaceae bacterium]
MMRWAHACAAVAILSAAVVAGCDSVGEGKGDVESANLYARDCWNGKFDLKPDFFAADPFRNTMHIRVQRGGDLLEVSDGIILLVDDTEDVRSRLGEAIPITLPPGVAPPGVPVGELCGDGGACNSPVHLSLYLLDSCHTENTVLYATSGTVTFDQLFSGDPNEEDAAEKLTDGHFDVMVGDPRDIVEDDAGGWTFQNQSQVTGSFRFYFKRGQPAQPFP